VKKLKTPTIFQHKSCICLVISSQGSLRIPGNDGNSGSESSSSKSSAGKGSADGNFMGTTGRTGVGSCDFSNLADEPKWGSDLLSLAIDCYLLRWLVLSTWTLLKIEKETYRAIRLFFVGMSPIHHIRYQVE
jgi:hypothetical protein